MAEDGSCLCGAVTFSAAETPDTLTDCNCGACRRLGPLWAYYHPDQVRLTGATVGYARTDLGEPAILAFHHCPTCGCVTHWASLTPHDRMGVNARLMRPQVVAAARVRRLDGADTWTYLDEV